MLHVPVFIRQNPQIFGVFSYDLHLEFLPLRSHYSAQWELARPSCFVVEYCQALLDCICWCIIRLIDIFEKYLDSRSCEILAYHTHSWEPKKGQRMKLGRRKSYLKKRWEGVADHIIVSSSVPNLLYYAYFVCFLFRSLYLDCHWPHLNSRLFQMPTHRLTNRQIPLLYLRQLPILLLLHLPHFYKPLTLLKDNSEQLLIALCHNFYQIDQLIYTLLVKTHWTFGGAKEHYCLYFWGTLHPPKTGVRKLNFFSVSNSTHDCHLELFRFSAARSSSGSQPSTPLTSPPVHTPSSSFFSVATG